MSKNQSRGHSEEVLLGCPAPSPQNFLVQIKVSLDQENPPELGREFLRSPDINKKKQKSK